MDTRTHGLSFCWQGFPEAQIQSLVKHFPKELLRLTDTHGQTALHVAASRGHLSLVQFFLTHGAGRNTVLSVLNPIFGTVSSYPITTSIHLCICLFLCNC